MSNIVKYIFRFILFVLVQEFILDKVPPVNQYVIPYLYFLFILWLPFSINRFALMFVAFLTGLSIDYFSGTPGLHAAPCVLIAYLRPFILNLLIPQETTEQSYVEPSIQSMGLGAYSFYIILFTFLHHAYMILIEWLQFGNFRYFFTKVGVTALLSILLISATEILFFRKAKYRTNAA